MLTFKCQLKGLTLIPATLYVTKMAYEWPEANEGKG